MGKLAVIVLGKRNAGKSSTWYYLFNEDINKRLKTGYKEIKIVEPHARIFIINGSSEETKKEVSEIIYLKNSSPEERREEIGDLLDECPPVVFCSVQYTEHGRQTIAWFRQHGYQLYIQWLNPGHHDKKEYKDKLGFREYFAGSDFHVVSGKEIIRRTDEIKHFFIDWYRENHK